MHPPEISKYKDLIEMAYQEDMGTTGDLTSNCTIFDTDKITETNIVFREDGILCGLPVIQQVLKHYDPSIELNAVMQDGQCVKAHQKVATIKGNARTILSAERVVLNFLQRLSAVATTTKEYVLQADGFKAKICDTRKTTPGWRELEKYAVRCGGGTNHRYGLFDAVLIKDNHLASFDSDLESSLNKAVDIIQKGSVKPEFIQVEVDNLDQLHIVLNVEAVDMVLLDNMSWQDLEKAVAIRDAKCVNRTVLLEASGGITLETIHSVAATGVDRISVGALTHSVANLDIGLDI